MSDPFASSRRKIAWAKKNITNLKRQITKFLQQDDLYTVFTEPDPHNPQQTIHKMRLAKHFPDGLSERTGDIVNNLREALDHTIYALSKFKKPSITPGEAYFPFASDAVHFENTLNGRCKYLPQELRALIRGYEPYKGGSEALWALNQVCGANKHAILVPVGTVATMAEVRVEGTGFWCMPHIPSWDWTKQEMELITVRQEAKLRANFHFSFYVAFGEIDGVAGKAAIPALDTFVEMVETIISEIEAESKRLGIVK
jgi:hypothetical protein